VSAVTPPMPSTGELPALSAQLEAELAQLQPRGPRRPWLQWSATMLSCVAYSVLVVALFGLRRDWVELPRAWQLGAGALWLAGLAIPLWLLMVPASGNVMGRWRAAVAIAVTTTLALVLLNALVHPAGPSSYVMRGMPWRGHACIEVSVGIAVIPTMILGFLLRGVYPVGGRAVAVVMGAATGSLAGLCMHLHCRIADGLHIVLFHCGGILVSAVLAWYLAPTMLDLPWNLRRHQAPPSP
jgi:hypothetical protein